jgi:hypothetical protein
VLVVGALQRENADHRHCSPPLNLLDHSPWPCELGCVDQKIGDRGGCGWCLVGTMEGRKQEGARCRGGGEPATTRGD